MPKLERNPAIYEQIANAYESMIRSGALRDGEKFPSRDDISRAYEVSRRTAQRVQGLLRSKKLIVTDGDKRHGHRVAPMRAVQNGGDIAYEPTGSAEADEVEVLSAREVAAPEYVAELLGVEEPDEDGVVRVSRREAVTRRGEEVIRLAVAWHATGISRATPELAELRLVNGLAAIARRTGRGATREKYYYEARTADEREAGHLRIEVGAPVLAGASLYLDGRGVVEYREWVTPERRVVSGEAPVHLPVG